MGLINMGSKIATTGINIGNAISGSAIASEKLKLLSEQLKLDKKKFGLEFALKRLMTMQQIRASEKEALVAELLGRSKAQSNFMQTQANEAEFRGGLNAQDRQDRINRGFAIGFSKAIPGHDRGPQTPQPTAPLLQQSAPQPAPVANQPQPPQSGSLLNRPPL